jgi:hypothetical protein
MSEKGKNKCPHYEFLNETFGTIKKATNREYWLYTEVFTYLHNGKDYCDYK